MKFAVHLPVDRVELGDEFVSADGVRQCSVAAEQAGFDALYVTDHPAPGNDWLAKGGHHSLDPFTALSFTAAATTDIRLFTNILVLPYRHPLIQAKAASSLDRLSGGRLMLGVGAGYLEPEFAALGQNLQTRGQQLEDTLELMKIAWRGESIEFSNDRYPVSAVTQLPTPIQPGGPELWMGGNSQAARRRAAKYCDGWLPIPVPGKMASRVRTAAIETMAALSNAIGEMRELEKRFERDKPLQIGCVPFGLTMQSKALPDAAALVEQRSEMRDMGVSWCTIGMPSTTRGEYIEALQQFRERVIAQL